MEANPLSVRYRARQVALGASLTREMLKLWGAIDLADIDGSWSSIEPGVLAVTLLHRERSVEEAGAYFTALRTAEGAAGVVLPQGAPPLPRLLTVATVRLLGPIGLKRNVAAKVKDPLGRSFTRLAGGAQRIALDGGRKALDASIYNDPEAKGFRRVTSASPCKFCADIASEGVLGKGSGFAAHGHCSCVAEAVYN